MKIFNASWWRLRNHPRLRRVMLRFHPRSIITRQATGGLAWNLAERAIAKGALHKQCELARMFALVAALRPRNLLEIGLSVGGTFETWPLLADEKAVIAGLDLHVPSAFLDPSPLARAQQRVTLVEGDSHSPSTLQRVQAIFPEGLDVLFIDGDHSYEGVRLDHQMYGPLVRKGGLIIFHDINPDDHERFGRRCLEDSGQVYRYWAELRRTADVLEFIEVPAQSGYGIGVLRVCK